MRTKSATHFSNDKQREILTNALIRQFGTCLIPLEALSLEFFSDSCVASAIGYTKALTNESFTAFSFYDSTRAPKFVLANDLSKYLLWPADF
ncbi:pyocin activator PrtN family protein [Alteromonas sp. S167]|uniref:pyocin activator PrtN family protein n=1 Tax=Alteromonas sp. S167 TaxID=3117402 RepID=UPI003F68B03B